MGLRRLRLTTGFVLIAYIFTHLINHSLGLISIEAQEAALRVQLWVWQGVVGTAALYAALATHLALGLWALYQRRHFGWTRTEVLQLLLGLAIPPLLVNHVLVTRISQTLFATHKGYAQELYSFWVNAPVLGVLQVTVLVVAWVHGCIGLYLWLRLRRRFAPAMPVLLCAATILPLLALLGFFESGRSVLTLAQEPAWRQAHLADWQVGTAAQNAALRTWRNRALLGWAGLLGLILLARLLRGWRERRGGTIRISYPDGRMVRMPFGFSVLDASRAGRVPHASVCGGRGRCSTCRVRVIAGGVKLPPPSVAEQAVLQRVAAAPSVRLACQLRPTGDIAVVPLLPPQSGTTALSRARPQSPGEERFVVAMVFDMRNSVRLAETRMPFDAVFIVDRFIAALDQAVVQAGGRSTHFTGDGLIATFGLDGLPGQACRQAMAALVLAGRNVAALNRALAGEMPDPILFGVGVHGSTAVVGEIGYGDTRVFTTLGEAVNIAARLEAMCKEFGCEAVVSDEVCRLSGLPLAALPLHETQVRGRSAALLVRTIAQVAGAQVAGAQAPGAQVAWLSG